MDTTVSYPISQPSDRTLGIPVFVFATVFASLSIVIGLIWDISWHISVGRDGLFSPPHLAMYLGAVISGVFSGYQVLKTTIAGTAAEKTQSVKFWKIFYGSLGAMFCIWGAIAMLTSAPFDDWWHNTYGLDVTILSPPHTVLLLGMVGIQFGAMVSVMAIQNRSTQLADEFSEKRNRILNVIYAMAGGFFLMMVCTILSEYQSRHDMHSATFYIVAGIFYPLLLSAFSRSSQSRWGATSAAAVYMLVQLLMNWILPLFPAEPKLGPILNPIDSFQSWDFPLLLIIPALALDYIQHKTLRNDWFRALIIGPAFILILLLVQWNMGDFLMTEYARNWVFGTETWYFGNSPDWEYRYAYAPWMVSTGWILVRGILIAIGIAVLTSRLGLYWGNWMKKVQR
ncbi:hypothetical protein [Fulvivirga sedimenti]|uniref:Uncharacterized protein n=1 Tax=Fulvivirga sedimenti TaxID=2879465 RepID=A0A9X1HTG6_9BACT|nr:hypothetical protein [Fulvivirga sedimenti]MCA6077968.1 hypothetical protein [Fulvivirga sedimenti]